MLSRKITKTKQSYCFRANRSTGKQHQRGRGVRKCWVCLQGKKCLKAQPIKGESKGDVITFGTQERKENFAELPSSYASQHVERAEEICNCPSSLIC